MDYDQLFLELYNRFSEKEKQQIVADMEATLDGYSDDQPSAARTFPCLCPITS